MHKYQKSKLCKSFNNAVQLFKLCKSVKNANMQLCNFVIKHIMQQCKCKCAYYAVMQLCTYEVRQSGNQEIRQLGN
jgi:hypothetical protein